MKKFIIAAAALVASVSMASAADMYGREGYYRDTSPRYVQEDRGFNPLAIPGRVINGTGQIVDGVLGTGQYQRDSGCWRWSNRQQRNVNVC